MVIDIIDLNDEAYANLSDVQFAMVREAQARKNEILAAAAEKKQKNLIKMLSRNVARSSVLDDLALEINADAEREVDVVREDLLYRIAYEENFSGGNEQGPYHYPENPNYNLGYPQRFLVVREYYMRVTSNPKARLEAFGMDSLAKTYLGEYYTTLYNLLASYVT